MYTQYTQCTHVHHSQHQCCCVILARCNHVTSVWWSRSMKVSVKDSEGRIESTKLTELANGTDSERSFVNDCIARSGRVESGRSVSLSVCLSCLYHHTALLATTVLLSLSLSLSLYCCLSVCSPASFSACLYVRTCLSACVCVCNDIVAACGLRQ